MDVVYLYPKTLCSTAQCKGEYNIPKNGTPTNMSVENCSLSPYYDCYYKAELNTKIEPKPHQGWRELNPQVYLNKLAKDFDKVPCQVCPENKDPQYISRDPRLFSNSRADYTVLDRPPTNGKVKLSEIYDRKWDGYGSSMHPYKDVGDGDITYYMDKSLSQALFLPVFAEPARETLNLFKDPMGSIKPETHREAILNTENPATTRPREYPYCLSSIQDSQSFREDLIAKQMIKRNQSRWEVRWPDY